MLLSKCNHNYIIIMITIMIIHNNIDVESDGHTHTVYDTKNKSKWVNRNAS